MASQQVRYAPPDITDILNPQKIFPELKPSRIIFGNTDPSPFIGELLWYYINNVTGDMFLNNGNNVDPWLLVYSFGGGGGGGTSADNVGGHTEIFRDKIGTTLNFRTLIGAKTVTGVPVSSVVNGDVVELSTSRALNTAVDFSAGDSIIKQVYYDPTTNSGTLFLKTFADSSSIKWDTINDQLVASFVTPIPPPLPSRAWFSMYNTNPSNIIGFSSGADVTYPLKYLFTTLGNGILASYTDSGKTYFYLVTSTPRYFKVDYSLSYVTIPGLAGEQILTFAITGTTDAVVQHSAINSVIPAGGSTSFKNGSVSHSFIMLLSPSIGYTISVIPRQVSGLSSSIDVEALSIIITDVQ